MRDTIIHGTADVAVPEGCVCKMLDATCSRCKKPFLCYPSAHRYQRNRKGKKLLFCSYSCMRADDKEYGKGKPIDQKARERVAHCIKKKAYYEAQLLTDKYIYGSAKAKNRMRMNVKTWRNHLEDALEELRIAEKGKA